MSCCSARKRSTSQLPTKAENKEKTNVMESQSDENKRWKSDDQQHQLNHNSADTSTRSVIVKNDQVMSCNGRRTYYPIAYYVKEF